MFHIHRNCIHLTSSILVLISALGVANIGMSAIVALAAPPAPGAPKVTRHATVPETLPDGRHRALWVDFGVREPASTKAINYDGTAPSDVFAWTGGMVRLVRREGPATRPGAGDFYEGEDAKFRVAVNTEAPCRLLVTLGDATSARGPVAVGVDGGASTTVRTAAGEFVDVAMDLLPEDGEVAVHLKALECASFAAVSVAVYVPPGARAVHALFHDPPPHATADTRTLLRATTDFLLEHRPAEGCFSYDGSWYQSSYSIRTLFGAARVLNDPTLLSPATECLDRFVDEQGQDGAWAAGYFGKPKCALARRTASKHASANLADVGAAVLALEVAAGQCTGPRRERFIGAARRFADKVALPNQLAGGAFPNLRFDGRVSKLPYSVATGLQAADLAALYQLTGRPQYLSAAEAAARHLVAGFLPDGRFRFEPHDTADVRVVSPCRFGDLYYVFEGLIWVRHVTNDGKLATSISRVEDAALWGSAGIAAARTNTALWKPANFWEASKQGALLVLLVDAREASIGDDAMQHRCQEWIDALVTWESDPARMRTLGALVHPASAEGRLALPATGFAGIGLVAAAERNALFIR
ncbi:MAG TPA: hypothetical protein VF720_13590 [Candidatus Eisenbacteria bacterium]